VTTLELRISCLVPPRDRAEEALRRLLGRLETVEPASSRHAELVESLATRVGQLLGLPEQQLSALRLGASLHDIGKLRVPRAILCKPGPLTTAEWKAMRRHPAAGVRLLAPILRSEEALGVVRSHHERWDGTGYPQQLAGREIPLGARVVAVADAYCAMVETRPYRPSLPSVDAVGELQANAGRQFDPACVEAACSALDSGGLAIG
jgi:HD-GYP domain-containing protein (c-di-GMP phosphodiesterase class II)